MKPGWQPNLAAPWGEASAPEISTSIFSKFLYLPVLKRNLDYQPSAGGSLVSRATYAASRVFFTREESGRGKLNTSYFLAALTAATVQTAYRPYWARSSSQTFNNFGSTIGSDAGMNVFHEFEPGLRQIVKSHTPKFVSSIQERITRDQRLIDDSLGRP